MGAVFHNFAMTEHIDAVGHSYRGKPMTDKNCRAAVQQLAESLKDLKFTLSIQGADTSNIQGPWELTWLKGMRTHRADRLKPNDILLLFMVLYLSRASCEAAWLMSISPLESFRIPT